MNYVELAGQLSRARALVEWWNEDNPKADVPWEWVEEMIMAKGRWHDLARKRSGEALDHYARYQEFRKKLPPSLTQEIFEKRRS